MDALRAGVSVRRGALAATDRSERQRPGMRANLQPGPLDPGLTQTFELSPEVPLLILRPSPAHLLDSRRWLLRVHEQDLDSPSGALRWLRGAQLTIVAPENPYPAPLDDCYRGLRWLVESAEQLDIDPGRVVVAGASAGGGLAAGGAPRARRLVGRSSWTIRASPSTPPSNRERNYAQRGSSVRSRTAAAQRRSIDLLLDAQRWSTHQFLELHVYAAAPHADAPALGGNSPLGRRARDEMIRWLRETTTDDQLVG